MSKKCACQSHLEPEDAWGAYVKRNAGAQTRIQLKRLFVLKNTANPRVDVENILYGSTKKEIKLYCRIYSAKATFSPTEDASFFSLSYASFAGGTSSSTVLTGPLNHFRADSTHDSDANTNTAMIITTA